MKLKHLFLDTYKCVCCGGYARIFVFLCLCCSLTATAQVEHAVSKEDSIAFRKYLHIDMPLHTDVVLLQNLYYSIYWEYEMGITGNTVPVAYSSDEGAIRYADAPTVALKRRLEAQFEAMHKDEAAFERGKQELVERLTAYSKEAKEHPVFFAEIATKFGGDIRQYVEYLYSESIMGNRKKFKNFMQKPYPWTIQRDPGFQFTLGLLLYEMILQGK